MPTDEKIINNEWLTVIASLEKKKLISVEFGGAIEINNLLKDYILTFSRPEAYGVIQFDNLYRIYKYKNYILKLEEDTLNEDLKIIIPIDEAEILKYKIENLFERYINFSEGEIKTDLVELGKIEENQFNNFLKLINDKNETEAKEILLHSFKEQYCNIILNSYFRQKNISSIFISDFKRTTTIVYLIYEYKNQNLILDYELNKNNELILYEANNKKIETMTENLVNVLGGINIE